MVSPVSRYERNDVHHTHRSSLDCRTTQKKNDDDPSPSRTDAGAPATRLRRVRYVPLGVCERTLQFSRGVHSSEGRVRGVSRAGSWSYADRLTSDASLPSRFLKRESILLDRSHFFRVSYRHVVGMWTMGWSPDLGSGYRASSILAIPTT